MQHRVRGNFTLDGPSYSVRAKHPLASRLMADGYAFQTSVGRWAVVVAVPDLGQLTVPGAEIQIYSVHVVRFTSKSAAKAHARRHRAYGPLFRARVVRWHRWMDEQRMKPKLSRAFRDLTRRVAFGVHP